MLFLIVGVAFGFYVQTVVGFGAALVAIPIIIHVLNLQEAVALMSIFFLIFSIVLIYKNRQFIDKAIILEMSVGILVGLVLGITILKFGNPIVLKKGLGVFLVLYVIYSYVKKQKIKLIKKLGLLFGFLGGFFGGLFSTGGPFFVIYIYNKLNKSRLVRATIIGVLGIIDFLRVPILIYSGILTYKVLVVSLYVLPFFFLSLFLGQKTHHRINENTFRNAVMVLLVLSGVSLIVR